MKKLVILATAIVFSSSVFAEPRERMFESMDTDGDGLVSQSEFAADKRSPMDRMIADTDTNGDGEISLAELKARQAERKAEMVEKMENRAEHMASMLTEADSDGNGSVSKAELRDHAFAKMDSNNDGYLDSGELRPPHGKGDHRGRSHRGSPHDE